ncbi:hypothetical protein HYV64_04845 [Candidatus Shapirobacteria bacterium]|nr:hypothetical protein [Candidatus Shapirobacteria bacterium]
MAAPTTHVVIAEKVFDKFFNGKDIGKFVVGTSFPDIRYLGVIDREKTHFGKIRLSEIILSDSFEAGVKFHSLVDHAREKFVVERGLYDFFIESPYKTQAMKLFEDGVLANKFVNNEVVAGYFNSIYDEERNYGIEESQIKKWHEMLSKYFLSTNSNEAVRSFVGVTKLPIGVAEEIINVIDNICSVEKAREIVLDFYENFEKLVA